MKALITGITGFAGTHLAEHLLACGDDVIGCSRAGIWRDDAPSQLKQHIELLPWDIGTGMPTAEMRRLAAYAPDCILHLAGMSIPADCGKDEPTAEAERTNVDGTRAVVEFAASLPSVPRLLLVSSCYVYAAIDPKHPVLDEDAPVDPLSGYGKTKLAAESVVLDAVESSRVTATIARVFQHCGPRQPPRTIVPEWALKLVRGDNPIRVGSLETTIDLTDVRDTVRAYRALVLRGSTGRVYNVGSGVARISGDIFAGLRRIHDPARSVIETAPGPRHNPIANISRISDETDWRPEIAFEQTLKDTLDFWQSQQTNQAQEVER